MQRSFGAGIQAVPERGLGVVSDALGRGALTKHAGTSPQITHGLLILEEPLDKILAGTAVAVRPFIDAERVRQRSIELDKQQPQ